MLEDVEEKEVEKDEHLPGSVEYQGCDQGVSKAKGDRVRWGTTRQDCPALVSKRSDKNISLNGAVIMSIYRQFLWKTHHRGMQHH